MSKTFKFNRDEQQQIKQTSKKAKLSKQQAGRIEKQFLRSVIE